MQLVDYVKLIKRKFKTIPDLLSYSHVVISCAIQNPNINKSEIEALVNYSYLALNVRSIYDKYELIPPREYQKYLKYVDAMGMIEKYGQDVRFDINFNIESIDSCL